MLGYQLESSVLKSGASSYLRPTLDALLGTGRSCCEPTIRSVDKAVTLLVDSIDWEKALGGPCQEVNYIFREPLNILPSQVSFWGLPYKH